MESPVSDKFAKFVVGAAYASGIAAYLLAIIASGVVAGVAVAVIMKWYLS